MKTYRNDRLGFEIDIPDEWPRPISLDAHSLLFMRTRVESLNFVVGPLLPERLLAYSEGEFTAYARKQGYTDLDFGRISAGGKNHLWARYQMHGGLWTKKYMIVFAYVEYDATATCYQPRYLPEREKVWDEIISSFRPTQAGQRIVDAIDDSRRRIGGDLYAKGSEAAGQERYAEACDLLQQCLEQDPDHTLAHKELAFILKNTGDLTGALAHRLIVKRLDPTDEVNRFNLAGIFFMLNQREDALREIDEWLCMHPSDRRFMGLKKAILEREPEER